MFTLYPRIFFAPHDSGVKIMKYWHLDRFLHFTLRCSFSKLRQNEPWVCPRCGAQNTATNDTCWNCSNPRPRPSETHECTPFKPHGLGLGFEQFQHVSF